ncbi:hypothetical protein [Amycolatopsis solani]|uniref:hypothetical protein n=1 Tax=Amycolatopsis solani TaxID=3028615 RepID=UPI0025B12AD7|nr:hypothetical protein [Amycolatopsis sp. MEP2-6]
MARVDQPALPSSRTWKWFVPPTRAWRKFRKLIEELPLKAGNAITLKRYAGVPV